MLFFGFHPFRKDIHTQALRHRNDGLNVGRIMLVGCDVAHKGLVNLENDNVLNTKAKVLVLQRNAYAIFRSEIHVYRIPDYSQSACFNGQIEELLQKRTQTLIRFRRAANFVVCQLHANDLGICDRAQLGRKVRHPRHDGRSLRFALLGKLGEMHGVHQFILLNGGGRLDAEMATGN